jgi:hypothetical protein
MRTVRSRTEVQGATSSAQKLGGIIKSCRSIMRKDKGLNGDLDRLPMLTWIMFLKFLDDMEAIREEESRLAGKRFKSAIDEPYRWQDWAAKPNGITGSDLIAFINQERKLSDRTVQEARVCSRICAPSKARMVILAKSLRGSLKARSIG